MKYIIFIICFISFQILFFLVRFFVDKKMSNKGPESICESNIIRQPKMFLYVGVPGLIVFFALAFFVLFAPSSMIADYDDDMRAPYAVLFFIFCLPYLILLLFRFVWRIEAKEESFIFRNVFGKKKEYKYDDINIKSTLQGTKIYINDKRILSISYYHENWYALEYRFALYKGEKHFKEIEQ